MSLPVIPGHKPGGIVEIIVAGTGGLSISNHGIVEIPELKEIRQVGGLFFTGTSSRIKRELVKTINRSYEAQDSSILFFTSSIIALFISDKFKSKYNVLCSL